MAATFSLKALSRVMTSSSTPTRFLIFQNSAIDSSHVDATPCVVFIRPNFLEWRLLSGECHYRLLQWCLPRVNPGALSGNLLRRA